MKFLESLRKDRAVCLLYLSEKDSSLEKTVSVIQDIYVTRTPVNGYYYTFKRHSCFILVDIH